MSELKKKIVLYLAMGSMVWTAGAPLFAIALDQVSKSFTSNAVNTYKTTKEYGDLTEEERNILTQQYLKGEIDETTYDKKIAELGSNSYVSNLIRSGTDATSKEILKTADTCYYTGVGLLTSTLLTAPIALASFHKLNKDDDPSSRHYPNDDDMEEAYHPHERPRPMAEKMEERIK